MVSWGMAQPVREGIFCHPPSGKCLYIENTTKGLLVKIKSNSSWRLFSYFENNIFFNTNSDRIEVLHPEEIVFIKRNSVRGLHYVCYEKMISGGQSKNDIPGNEIIHETVSVEGLWYNDEYDEHVIVTETRDGIKVRLRDARTWYSYFYSGPGQKFRDEKGNSYTFENGRLTYFYNDGYHTILFYKISENFDGY